jgi:hypothetical protein
MFQYAEAYAIMIGMRGMDVTEIPVRTPRFINRLNDLWAWPPEPVEAHRAAPIKASAKFTRNSLKRLISDERIQGNPSFSNPV